MATFAAGLRTPYARYWLSGFLADFGDGVRLAAFPLRRLGLVQHDGGQHAAAPGPAALLGRVSSLFGIVARSTEALGALAGGALAATAGIRARRLAGAPPLAAAVAVLAWRHRKVTA